MLQPDQKFAHFTILRQLGAGGMGEVYLARDDKLKRQIALKVLHPEFFDNPERLERLTREAQTAAKVSHPNVMAIYDIGSAPMEESGRDVNYIVMEHVQGQPLSDYLSSRDVRLPDLLRVAGKVAAGLAAAHKLGIVHRDIKPENIMIDEQGEPKILDFGLAKPVASTFAGETEDGTQTVSRELTQEGKIVGTVTYMSPEQARGEQVDARSDVFSFGSMLYRMVTGQGPFDAPDRVSTIAKVLEGRHTPIRQTNELLPAELERIVDKCLQKNPNDRYQDTRDLVVDLRSLRRQYDSGVTDVSSAITDSSITSARTSSLRGTGGRLLAIVLGIVVVAVALRYLWPSSGETGPSLQARENALAILGFENKTGDTTLDWLTAGLPEIILTDLAQGGSANIIARSRVLDCLDDKKQSLADLPGHEECVRAARRLGASQVISGSFYKLGDKLRIDARLEDVESGQVLMGEKVIGEDPFVLVDSLTQKIAQLIDVQGLMADQADVSQYTSKSPEAYKQYILGMEQFAIGRFDDAIPMFEKAIEIDSTFALPYMRIGMAYGLQGRRQQAGPYLQAAERLQGGLPRKERSFVEIYSDVWLRNQFEDATIKLKTLVANYPDDKEARAFYGIILTEIGGDVTAGIAQLDTSLLLDPRFPVALSFLSDVYRGQDDYVKATEYARRMREYYSNSPRPYIDLALLYRVQGQYDDAIDECQALLELDPRNADALTVLNRLFILKRDFEGAAGYNDELAKIHGDDPYLMVEYHDQAANLASWRGQFRETVRHKQLSVDQFISVKDSNGIANQYQGLAGLFLRLGQPDSALHYAELGLDWAIGFQHFGYANLLVRIDRSRSDEARRHFRSALDDFKARLPQAMWGLANSLSEIFEGAVEADTSRMLAGMEDLINDASGAGGQSGNRLEYGELLVASGQYEKGLEALGSLLTGGDQTTGALGYLRAAYYTGVAHEGLGDIAAAREKYEEILRYWGNADVQTEEIIDTRRRLGRLTG